MTGDPRARALAALPTAYAVALRMHEGGRTDAEIAHALGIDPVGVATLLDLARAKLETLLADNWGEAR